MRYKPIDLVLHQRDQRRNDDRQTIAENCRHPVAEALARTGWRDREHVATVHLRLHHLGLARPEGLQVEDIAQHLLGSHESSVRHRRAAHQPPLTAVEVQADAIGIRAHNLPSQP